MNKTIIATMDPTIARAPNTASQSLSIIGGPSRLGFVPGLDFGSGFEFLFHVHLENVPSSGWSQPGTGPAFSKTSRRARPGHR